jgi:hypothetical protein
MLAVWTQRYIIFEKGATKVPTLTVDHLDGLSFLQSEERQPVVEYYLGNISMFR